MMRPLGGQRRAADKNNNSNLQRRHRPDYQIVLFTGLLMLLGLIIMYAIGPQRANVLNTVHGTDFYTPTYFVIKQLASLGLAIAAFAVFAKMPFKLLQQKALLLVKIGFGLCALLFIGGNILHINAIATDTLGAYRWFNLGPLGTFQPAEVLKFALLLFLSGFLGRRYNQGKINDLQDTVYPAAALSALALFVVVVLQKDMGTGIAMASVVAGMLVVSSMSWKILAKIAVIVLIAGVLLTVFVPHRRDRLMTFIQGDKAATSATEASDNNYHIKNAMIALGTGGVTGLGIGNSVQATGYLPEAINDSIFAVIGEIFGWVGTTVVIILFTALLVRLLRIADHLPDMPMRLAVAGVFGWLGAHVVMNIASMIGFIPLTGITLPLLSFGGTSMVFMTGALGLVYQLSRYTSHGTVVIGEAGHESTGSWRRIGGSRNPGARRYQRAR